jgi:hypothetical protein
MPPIGRLLAAALAKPAGVEAAALVAVGQEQAEAAEAAVVVGAEAEEVVDEPPHRARGSRGFSEWRSGRGCGKL